MILLAGIPSEPPIAMVREAAQRSGLEVCVLNQRAAGEMVFEQREQVDACVLRIGGRCIPMSRVRGVYLRLTDHRRLPEYTDDPDGMDLLHGRLREWVELTACRVMNRPSDMASNQSKPYQAQLIAQVGFRVPETLITNDPRRVRAFVASCGKVVFKSISAERSVVRLLRGADLARLDEIRVLPTQFQAWVPGTDVRVHVVGDEVFAVRIGSEATDYRYATQEGAGLEMEPTRLPDDVRSRCLALSRRLTLPLCGVDLRLDPDGRWWCFEVNPSPAFSWYEEWTHQPIALAIARWLGVEP